MVSLGRRRPVPFALATITVPFTTSFSGAFPKMNKNLYSLRVFALLSLILAVTAVSFAQTPERLKRTTYKTKTVEAGPGTTLAITGAPAGAIRIEGWKKNEIEISAEIEVSAGTEDDLTQLAKVTGFLVDEGLTKISVTTVGPNDKKYLKKAAKGFPKRLRNSPFQINYSIKVPVYSDLIVNGGRGDFRVSGVDGSMIIEFLESNAELTLSGGAVRATFAAGNVTFTAKKPSWRGRFADIQLASGRLDVKLPADMNADVTANVLRTGSIENAFKNIKPKRRTSFTDQAMTAVAGNGGARLKFTVGDGTLSISEADPPRIAENQ